MTVSAFINAFIHDIIFSLSSNLIENTQLLFELSSLVHLDLELFLRHYLSLIISSLLVEDKLDTVSTLALALNENVSELILDNIDEIFIAFLSKHQMIEKCIPKFEQTMIFFFPESFNIHFNLSDLIRGSPSGFLLKLLKYIVYSIDQKFLQKVRNDLLYN